MVWTRNLATVYHQQNTDYYCGGATAQMILEQIGAGLLNQNTLYNSNHNNNTESGWSTDPDGLAKTLRNNRPSNFTNTFVVYKKSTEVEGTQKIVYTIWKYSVATGTLVFGDDHWICVRGISTSIEPKPGTTYSINGLWINNPWPPVPSFYNNQPAQPPPHTATDGCGTGFDRGIDNEYVVYDPDWKNTYLTGCTWNGSFGYISVCDPETPKLGKLDLRKPEFWAKGDQMITPNNAIEFALRGVEIHNLTQDKIFSKALNGSKPQDPILVQRLDLLDTYYYIVPIARNGEVTAMLRVDGIYGNFQGGKTVSNPKKNPFTIRRQIIKNILENPLQLDNKKGSLIVRKEAFCFYPTMVWRPCKESRSPYYPFYMVTVGSHRVYIGYDGTIYPDLHDIGRGG